MRERCCFFSWSRDHHRGDSRSCDTPLGQEDGRLLSLLLTEGLVGVVGGVLVLFLFLFSLLFVGSMFPWPMSDSASSVASPRWSACHVSLFGVPEGLDGAGEILRARIEVVGWD